MFSESLQRLECLLLEHIGAADLPSLAEEARRLSASFTKGRAERSPDYLDDPRCRLAYVAHFLLTNAAKVLHGLDEAQALGLIADRGSFRLLDLGCGPGTASLAASLFFAERFPQAALESVGVDRSEAALADAVELFRRITPTAHRFDSVVARAGDRAAVPGRFDIIVAANVINEFGQAGEAIALCRDLIRHHLEPDGFLLIVDPALRETTRPLMKLRDELVASGAAVLAPCLHAMPCPMLSANERDWCHFSVAWERPKLIERMDRLTGLDHRYPEMAYLMLAPEGRRTDDREAGMWRVVSHPLVSKGKKELLLCGGDGALVKMMRQDKHASDANRDVDIARRGDVVSCTCNRKITSTDRFAIRRRWQ